ncbi:hypothetical protein SAY87_003960 [Trapa incisa]|uniref:Lsm14-like N-terminal domain-containing protein n=1 Tax=Trapa incisa TaxID=236973 RepID=A0AAN7JPA3_9MYRT|nr:hypothetical protein SAY87_003960 [Trapa incisa]
MASPVAAFSSSGSADSCKASLLNIVTKSEMRYEGFLYNINFHDATIGLKNVRSFGTEGRRKDGPEVLPDNRVFEYVQFSENDIKDLQVFQSPAPQNVSSVLDDPAIIQTHYTPPALTSKSAPYASSQSMANLSMGGLQNLAVKGIILLLSPFRNLESTQTLLAPPRGQMNTSEIQLHVQGSEGPSTGIPFVEQQSLVGSAQGLTAMYPMKQQMHHHAFNYSIPR